MSLAENLFKLAAQTNVNKGGSSERINNSFRSVANVAIAKQQLALDREKMEDAKKGMEYKRIEVAGKLFMDGAKLPPKLRLQYNNTLMVPALAQMGLKADPKILNALATEDQINMDSFASTQVRFMEALRKNDKQTIELLGPKIAGVLAGDPNAIAEFTLKSIKEVNDQLHEEKVLKEDQKQFRVNKMEDFNKGVIKLKDSIGKDLQKIDMASAELKQAMGNLDRAQAENNGPLLNQTIKNIVRQTDSRITDKDFQLISERLGVLGWQDRTIKAAGRVPKGLVEDVKGILEEAQKSHPAQREAVMQRASLGAQQLAQNPYATKSAEAIMNEFQAASQTRNAGGDKGPPKQPGTNPGAKLSDKLSTSQIEAAVDNILTNPELKNRQGVPMSELSGDRLRAALIDELIPDGYTVDMVDDLLGLIEKERSKRGKKGGK